MAESNTPKDPTQTEKRDLDVLLKSTYPAAAYDAPEHPRPCHPGTRARYISRIVNWGSNDAGRKQGVFWLKGQAGVGKSSLAQTCAEEFAARKKLAATFYFSCPNLRDNPQRLFTTMSYQLASKHKSYGEIIKSIMHDNPSIVSGALPLQFHQLFVSPLQALKAKGEEVTERVVIIDGLDECRGEDAQHTIVKIIAESVRDHTTPFAWIFSSRTEPNLIETFGSKEISAVTVQEELAG
ncbi:hypothetical protein P691DRAFT_808305 [Macrolepiota fuliginosa MF-IS2]|uniref:Nephrocystin 3-like N-terminal domain-containing protein n=1 Tax=Macrolepiota fuliginosa MF-IS2 TaxID=1400762 RepID=A0A9P5X568_9AGAR|nr:hypothetical protein P691DRAFT_808305 [Macrolepiota fuliginosa MF-IS2]